jgi:hypothetical protein
LDGVASNCNFICNIPCKYRKIHLTAIQCSMLGFAMCWLNTLIGYAKSGHVHNMAYIKDPTACWYGNPFDSSFPFAFLCNFTLGSNGTWAYNPPFENASIFPWGIWFGWCVGIVHHDSFPPPSSKRNATPWGPSFQTFDSIPFWFAKVCFDRCTHNEVIHIDHYEKLHISHLCNVHTRIGLTFHKLNAFEKCI